MQVAHRSEIGHRRERNEDALLVDDDRPLFVVADGMGGHPAGHVASQVAVESLDASLPASELTPHDDRLMKTLSNALRAAHGAIHEDAEREPSREGMGTTAVVATLGQSPPLLTFAHVGDSRAYLFRGGEGRQLTHDHTRGGLFGRMLTQALGTPGAIEPEAAEIELEPGDHVLLCTDGLTDMVSDDGLADIMAGPGSVQDCCDELVKTALEAGGHDNISVIVIDPQ